MAPKSRYPRGDRRRDEITLKVLNLFAERSFRSFSLRDLAWNCDISLAGLMHHFGSKEDLYVAVLRRRDELALERSTATTPIAGVLELLSRTQAQPGLVELYIVMSAAGADPNHPAAAYLVERQDRLLTLTKRALPPHRQPAAAELTRLLGAVIEGLQRQWLVDRDLDVAALVSAFLGRFPELREGARR